MGDTAHSGSAVYETLNRAWKATTRIVLGEEIGELCEFGNYLNEMVLPYRIEKSALSGRDVMVSMPYYPENARFISQEESDKAGFKPLNINEIKDMDSLFAAVGERLGDGLYYCGNKTFGKCSAVEVVDNCTDCICVSNAHDVYNVRHGAYLSYLRESEYAFGVSAFPKSRHVIRCLEGIGFNRCFECYYARNLSDAYYTSNCQGCSSCFFAFNLRSKHNVIGNLELPKERYAQLRKKLLAEMTEELRKNKRLFSIADVSNYGGTGGGGSSTAMEEETANGEVPEKVEGAFRKTTRLVLGKEFHGIRQFGPWLSERIMKTRKIKGAYGTPTYKVDGLPVVCNISPKRLLTLHEALATASAGIEIKDGEAPGLRELLSRASKIAYFTFEFVDGFNENTVDTPTVFTATDTYRIWDATNTKHSAYSTAPVHCAYIFGGFFWIIFSEFCINCYNSSNIKNCFEVDSCHASSNCYFCHNCENVQEGMFCFNLKGKKYAIANTEVKKEEYLRVKQMLLKYLGKSLEKNKAIRQGIFSIGNSDMANTDKVKKSKKVKL